MEENNVKTTTANQGADPKAAPKAATPAPNQAEKKDTPTPAPTPEKKEEPKVADKPAGTPPTPATPETPAPATPPATTTPENSTPAKPAENPATTPTTGPTPTPTPSETPKDKEKKPEEADSFKPIETRKVLVVDSDKAVMHEIDEFTKRKAVKGLKFFFAEDAKVCLEKMKSEKIDIAIIEILLPIINGRYLLKIFEKQNIPAIIYTKLNNVEDLKKMTEWSAANIFLKKLTKPEDLVQFLKSKTEYKEDLKGIVEKLLNEMKNQEGKESQSSVKIVQCPKCHMILPPQSHFCNNCGQKIVKENKPAAINAKPAPAKETKK